MEQHPIPQQISSYEFKLIGEMTLKQFLKAAGGILLAVAVNSTGLIFFIKWPLMIILAAGGLALAFVPFEDRPLETWLVSFIKSIYSPTIFTYKKQGNKNWLDLDESKIRKEEEEKEKVEQIPVKDEKKVSEFIKSLPSIKREEVEETAEELEKVKEEEVKIELPKVEEKKEPAKVEIKPEPVESKEEVDWREKKANLNLKTEKLGATGAAVFGSIPMPDIPEIPNLIMGMVTDATDKIIEGAIVEIQDEKGNPNRVLKTNTLGQFRSATPLTSGKYLVITEREGLKFDRVEIDLKGQIVEPIKIKAIS